MKKKQEQGHSCKSIFFAKSKEKETELVAGHARAFSDELMSKIETLSEEKIGLVREVAELKVAGQRQSKAADALKQELEETRQQLKMKQHLDNSSDFDR